MGNSQIRRSDVCYHTMYNNPFQGHLSATSIQSINPCLFSHKFFMCRTIWCATVCRLDLIISMDCGHPWQPSEHIHTTHIHACTTSLLSLWALFDSTDGDSCSSTMHLHLTNSVRPLRQQSTWLIHMVWYGSRWHCMCILGQPSGARYDIQLLPAPNQTVEMAKDVAYSYAWYIHT